jgi:hypothetical protein
MRSAYRNTLAFALMVERRLWGSRADIRRVMVMTARAFRAERSVA